MTNWRRAAVTLGLGMALAGGCAGQRDTAAAAGKPGDAARPAAEPVLERPTYRSLGAYWIITGDANANATIELQYRKEGGGAWTRGADLFRVEPGANDEGAPSQRKGRTKLPVPEGSWLFAGSALMLEPDTAYELKLTLKDPDGGKAEKTLKSRTIAEPVAPGNLKTVHVVPGDGGGSGTQADPYKGLAAADAAAQPGTLVLVHAGRYPAPFVVGKSGEKGRPIIYRGAGDGEAVIEGRGKEATPRGVQVIDRHDVWFEDLSIRNTGNALVGHESARLVVRRCRITESEYGINSCGNEKDQLLDHWISDNTIIGPSTWPRSKGIEDARGIQVSGAGHVIAYNHVEAFADAIDTFPSPRCEAIDIHNNEVVTLTDDAIEMDYSERNTRCFENRCTNVFQGISTQPIFGGPVYIFRNVLHNVIVEPFKIHNNPSGGVIVHNTVVKKGEPMVVMTTAGMSNFVIKNNLFIGAPSRFASQMNLSRITSTEMDYNGYGGGPWATFLRWETRDFKTLEDVRKHGPAERHAVMVDPKKAFASGAAVPADPDKAEKPVDLRLAKGSEAVDAGVDLPGYDQDRKGRKPDLGAYELGQELPHYGPRNAKK